MKSSLVGLVFVIQWAGAVQWDTSVQTAAQWRLTVLRATTVTSTSCLSRRDRARWGTTVTAVAQRPYRLTAPKVGSVTSAVFAGIKDYIHTLHCFFPIKCTYVRSTRQGSICRRLKSELTFFRQLLSDGSLLSGGQCERHSVPDWHVPERHWWRGGVRLLQLYARHVLRRHGQRCT